MKVVWININLTLKFILLAEEKAPVKLWYGLASRLQAIYGLNMTYFNP